MDYERHPLSAEYEDITGSGWVEFLENFETNGFDPDQPITLHEGKILDGWQRYRACGNLGIEPVFKEFDSNGTSAEAYVEMVNLHRRQLDPERVRRRAARRRDRVAEARARGMSIRAIAEQEHVSPKTIQDDLDCIPDTPAPPDGKVTGKDGRKQAAKKGNKKANPGPTPCSHCKDRHFTAPNRKCPICMDKVEKSEKRQKAAEEKEAAKKEKVGLKNAIMTAAETAAFFDALIPRDGEGQALDALRLTARRVSALAKAFAEGRK